MGARKKGAPLLLRMESQRRALEHKFKLLQRKELLALPRRAGLDSVDSLILALVEYASPATKARFKAAGLARDGAEGNGNVARLKFSPEVRNVIRKELEAGEKSVAEIAREYGPSHPTIMGWKRAWGLTRPRSRHSKGNGSDN
jgi:hypothetical protein